MPGVYFRECLRLAVQQSLVFHGAAEATVDFVYILRGSSVRRDQSQFRYSPSRSFILAGFPSPASEQSEKSAIKSGTIPV